MSSGSSAPPEVRVEKQDALEALATLSDFREELHRVQARIERTDSVFSLVIFEVVGPNRHGLAQDVAYTLLNRVRAADFVGWFDRTHVGVILDGCRVCSALGFANSVCRKIAKRRHPPRRATIQTFPAKFDVDRDVSNEPCSVCDEGKESGTLTCPTLCLQKSVFLPSAITVEYGTTVGAETRPPAGAGLPWWKRTMDVSISLAVLFVLSPILVLAALIVKLTSSGAVIYRQERTGYLGHPFVLYKFRSMSIAKANPEHEAFMKHVIEGENGADDEPMLKQNGNPEARTTKIGHILRCTCLDEVPQLVNVLKGDMSLVGPRPPIRYEVEAYKRWHGGRFDSVPGLTGLWQVSGKNRLSFKEMARLDIQYSRNVSFWLDLKILFKTPIAVWDEFCHGVGIDKRVD